MFLNAILMLTLATGQAPGAGDSDTFPPGQMIERVRCQTDSSQSYALYLPSGYSTGKRWPVLIVMDPRGRAVPALQRFRAAAERHGYILASSYDTASDGPAEPNVKALQAMLPDVDRRFSVDMRRHYLAGFSGTARMGWHIGALIPRQMAGLIGFGAGFPPDFTPDDSLRFVFFGGAGTTDFNYEEVRAMDKTLDAYQIPHHIELFQGPHSWPPETVCAQALGWMELQAMKTGMIPTDTKTVEELFTRWMDHTRELKDTGQVLETYLRYRSLVEDFAGLRELEELRQETAELEASPAVRQALTRQQQLDEERAEFDLRFNSFLQQFRSSQPPPQLVRSLRTLQVKNLQERAAKNLDTPEALSAQRLLAQIFTMTSFYEPKEYLRQGAFQHAEAILQIAAQLQPEHPRVCYAMAQVHAQMGKKKKALEDLSCAVSSGHIGIQTLEGDPYLEPLRKNDTFKEIVQQLRTGD